MSYYNAKTYRNLIEDDIRHESLSGVLDKCQSDSEKGQLVEALWLICTAFRLLPNHSNIKVVKSNVNKGLVSPISNFDEDFLDRKLKQGKRSGYSDITFLEGDYCVLSSCKRFVNEDSKSLGDYDLGKLKEIGGQIKRKTKTVVFTESKSSFYKTLQNAETKGMYESDLLDVFDQSDLSSCYNELKRVLNLYNYDLEEITKSYLGQSKKSLKLRFHQQLALIKTEAMPGKGPIVWAMKPRSGKSYIIAGDILRNDYKNVLILTPVPSETIPQYRDDLFARLVEFDGYKITHVRSTATTLEPKCRNIIICSKQFLQHQDKSLFNGLKIDAIYCDENAYGGTTTLSKRIVNNYRNQETKLVLVTATPAKCIREWRVPENRCLFWDLEDEKLCKEGDTGTLIAKHGDEVSPLLPFHNLPEEYESAPTLSIKSTLFHKPFVKQFNEFNTDSSCSFDIDRIFDINPKNNQFSNTNYVNHLLDYYFGNNINNGINITDRIKKESLECGSRTSHKFNSQIWYLPYGANRDLDLGSELTRQAIERHPKGKNYRVSIINSKRKEYKASELKSFIESEQKQAQLESKDGLIILAGCQAVMGITLPLVDIVVLLNNLSSMDMVYQMSMRCLTEDADKKKGFVVDLNPKRVLDLILRSTQRRSGECVRDMLKRVFRTIDFDSDLIHLEDKSDIIDEVHQIWRNSILSDFSYLSLGFDDLISTSELTPYSSKIANFIGRSNVGDLYPNSKIQVPNEDEWLKDAVGEGRLGAVQSDKATPSKCDEVDPLQNYGKEVLFSSALLGVFLTAGDKEYDLSRIFGKVLSDIGSDLGKSFIDQCNIWWSIDNPYEFVKLLKEFAEALITKHSKGLAMSEWIEAIKNRVQHTPQKKKLADFINSMMKPKKIETKMLGEVFTPLKMVEEMLDKLPSELWSNKDLRWFDPCVGIGNFLICVYDRLMVGLADQIVDEEDRKRHILQNMLYMSEINTKNVYICKNAIFGEGCNIYEGDTLQLDTQQEWGVSKFDVVLGNPPYQDASGNKGAGHILWDRFVKKANDLVNDGGYICLVHPSLWRKANHKIRETIMSNNMLYLEIHNHKDGQKNFKVNTRYDWYVSQRSGYSGETIVVGEDGVPHTLDLRTMPFIPSANFDTVQALVAKKGEERVRLVNDRSAYGADKKWVAKERNEEYRYPCVYMVKKNNEPVLRWSNRNDNGHFGVPKVIFGIAASQGAFADHAGKYAMTQWCGAIIDHPDYLDEIAKAITSDKFRLFCSDIAIRNEVNLSAVSYFRKDFWKLFSN